MIDVGAGRGVAMGELLAREDFRGDVLAVDPNEALHLDASDRAATFHDAIGAMPVVRKAEIMLNVFTDIAYDADFVGAIENNLRHLQLGGRLYVALGSGTTAVHGLVIEKLAHDVELIPLELVGLSPGKPPARIYMHGG